MIKKELKQLLKEKYGNELDPDKFKGEEIYELDWYANKFNLCIDVYKVVNLNEEDYEDPKWRPVLEIWDTYGFKNCDNENVACRDMIIYKTPEGQFHLLAIKSKESIEQVSQCPYCGTYINKLLGGNHYYNEHIRKCRARPREEEEEMNEDDLD